MTTWIWRNLFCRIGLHRYAYWTKADWFAELRSCEFCGRQEKA